MQAIQILFPMTALALWTLFMYGVLGRRRVRVVKEKKVNLRYYRRYDEGQEPDETRFVARNVSNLFEMPVLFYAVCLLIFAAQISNLPLLILAWVYVALRVVHSLVHVTRNVVPVRFNIFVVSDLVLAAMCILVLVRLIQIS